MTRLFRRSARRRTSPVADPDLFEDDNSFLATTGRRIPVYFHNEHRQLPWCRELWPVPRIEINPEDAERIGVEQGDWVWIETKERKIREVVDLYHGIAPGVVNLEHQWWFPELKQADKGFALCGVQLLAGQGRPGPVSSARRNLRAYAREGVQGHGGELPVRQSRALRRRRHRDHPRLQRSAL